PSLMIKAFAPGASRDLVKVARGKNARLLSAILAELREKHRADRDINAHAKRIRAADHFQQPTLSKLLHEDAVTRQQPRVVNANPGAEPFLNVWPIGAVELHAFECFIQRGLFLLRGSRKASEILRAFRRFELR